MDLNLAAAADVAAIGKLTATRTCAALQSIRKASNPGNVALVLGSAYDVLPQYARVPTHYRIRVEGAEPAERWVSIDCGTYVQAALEASEAGSGKVAATSGTEAVLSLTWYPSFCETHTRKAECAKQGADSFAARHFTLRGLWPRASDYCNVGASLIDIDKKGKWATLPEVDLSGETRERLAEVMPGVLSALDRHEWLRHGTCYGGLDSGAYFGKAIALLDEVNASGVQAFFADKIGETVTTTDIRAAFDSAFGAGAGDRVSVSCTKNGSRQLVTEIRIGLAGPDAGLAAMMKAASAIDADCQGGIVDEVALQ